MSCGKTRWTSRCRAHVLRSDAERTLQADATRSPLLASRATRPSVIVGITGHQVLRTTVCAFVEAHLEDILRDLPPPLIGWSSVAAGADQIFAETVLRLGGKLNIVIPARAYDTTFSEDHDRQRYRALLACATAVETLNYSEPSERTFFDAGWTIVNKVDLLLAVWDGQPAHGLGGTADIVRLAEEKGTPVRVIWPPGVKR